MSVSASRVAVLPEDAVSIARIERPVRRRANREQGRALEILGHAVEYLADSWLWGGQTLDGDAIDVLKQASREVFRGCAVVVPLRERMGRWLGYSRVDG